MSIFTNTVSKRPNYSTFNLSHSKKFTTKFGFLTPCFLMDTVPGDVISVDTASLIRTAPLATPVMHEFSAYMHYFFVPNRLLWDDWQDYISDRICDKVS